MNNFSRFIAVLAFSVTGVVALAQAPVDGFMKGKRQGVLALSAGFEGANDYFTSPTTTTAIGRSAFSASVFTAYGLSNKINIQANIPFVSNDNKSGPQDGSIYIKAQPIGLKLGEKSQFSAIAAGGFSGPLSPYETESASSIGQQAVSFDGRVILQFYTNYKFFIQAQSGYTFRLDPVPHSYPIFAKAGLTWPKTYMDVWYEVQEAIGGKDYRGVGDKRATSFRQLGVSYHRAGATFFYAYGAKTGISLGAYTVLQGRNAFKATGGSIGWIYQFEARKTENLSSQAALY